MALVVSGFRRVDIAVPLVLLVGGLFVRYAIRANVGSDVLDVTRAAIDQVLAGASPYGIGYDVSRPPGAPFPYGPLAIFWYVPFADTPRVLELFSATAVATALAIRGRLLGLAIYAAAPAIVNTSVDGSNDTTLGLLLLLTFAIAETRPRIAAVVLAAAVAFKVSAVAWVPAFALWAGLGVVVPFLAASVVLWLPVLAWGPAGFLDSLSRANTLHRDIVWSLGAALQDLLGERVRALDNVRFALGGFAAVASLRWVRSLDGVIIAGTVVYLITLFGGTWGTFAYLAAIAPLLCWRIDDWLGLPVIGPLRADPTPESTEPSPEQAAAPPAASPGDEGAAGAPAA